MSSRMVELPTQWVNNPLRQESHDERSQRWIICSCQHVQLEGANVSRLSALKSHPTCCSEKAQLGSTLPLLEAYSSVSEGTNAAHVQQQVLS